MTVYLLHLDTPLSHAQHYLGSTGELAVRLEQHGKGRGSKLLAECRRRGISFRLVRTWEGGRSDERRLKRQKNSRRFCPLCRSDYLRRQRERSQNRVLEVAL